ncbi:PadR family transcriptional regulator [Nonomuraea sp. NN258]|uniref:PadR family transcriptional regulator n=1 Tax=Nonomuraea antri TaxID=2730852 RepID=UPI001569E281|nr:PadR family transcriptional regulator [Nonomuraea antri]NRQ35954.1 PadR family transcriptional regulator [Nonomuraea antri]
MSSIRIFILSALSERGPMHGHHLRLLSEEEHLDQWTDITTGGLYGAIKRLAAEGLIEEARTEKVGSYPARKVWRITEAGARALSSLKISALREIVFRPDPFDLAITRLDPDRLDDLESVVAARLGSLRAMLTDYEAHMRTIAGYLSPAETLAMRHHVVRLQAEITWHQELVARLPQLTQDEKARRTPHDHGQEAS